MTKEGFHILKYFIFLLYFFVFILLVILCSISVTYFFLIPDKEDSGYLHQKRLERINEFSLGHIPNYRKKGEKRKIRNIITTKENHLLTTNFGSRDYRCTGTCYCEQEYFFDDDYDNNKNNDLISTTNERRRTSSILRRPISFFVAAISSIFAVNLAKKTLQEKCKIELSETCISPSHIHTEVSDCQQKQRRDDDDDDDDVFISEDHDESIITTTKEEDEETQKYTFQCKGFCGLSEPLYVYGKIRTENEEEETTLFEDRRNRIFEMEKECSLYSLEGEISVITNTFSEDFTVFEVREEFRTRKLQPFCDSISPIIFSNSKSSEKDLSLLFLNHDDFIEFWKDYYISDDEFLKDLEEEEDSSSNNNNNHLDYYKIKQCSASKDGRLKNLSPETVFGLNNKNNKNDLLHGNIICKIKKNKDF